MANATTIRSMPVVSADTPEFWLSANDTARLRPRPIWKPTSPATASSERTRRAKPPDTKSNNLPQKLDHAGLSLSFLEFWSDSAKSRSKKSSGKVRDHRDGAELSDLLPTRGNRRFDDVGGELKSQACDQPAPIAHQDVTEPAMCRGGKSRPQPGKKCLEGANRDNEQRCMASMAMTMSFVTR